MPHADPKARLLKDRGTILYARVGVSWDRRVEHSTSALTWQRAARVPKAVRQVGERFPTGPVHVEFNTATRTAALVPSWRAP